jgi:hypothetical protein
MIYYLAPEIESFLGESWRLRPLAETEVELTSKYRQYSFEIPHYDFWVYLRHNGFPSPLLDWSKSPFVALFFAVADPVRASRGALFVYVERPKGSKGGVVGGPLITVKHPYVKTHKRHFLQQSYYTLATKADDVNKDHEFVPHDTIFEDERMDQDLLFKLSFPQSIRAEALEALNEYNINHFSLFQSEDSLVKSLANRAFDC